jgi:hypothetical protein
MSRIDLWNVLGQNRSFDRVDLYVRSVDSGPASVLVTQMAFSRSASSIGALLVYQTQSGTPEGSNATLQDLFADPSNGTSISYQRVSPTEVSIKYCANQPGFLNFREAYHDLWRGLDGPSTIFHFRISDLSNGFVIDTGCQKNITLSFQEEPLYQLGIRISAVTLAITSVVVLLPIGAFKKHRTWKMIARVQDKPKRKH